MSFVDIVGARARNLQLKSVKGASREAGRNWFILGNTLPALKTYAYNGYRLWR